MQSELDKIYEEEYEERLEKRFAKGHEEGVREGIVMGREEGREEEKSAIVQKMKNEGIPIDLISRCTGLSSDEIQAI